ncbi:MAG: hypothetical protein WHV66_14795 [Anaerolineales bacterium]
MISEVSYPNENEIKTRVIIAICRLYCHDQDLLDVGVNERSLTHKLAEYLQDEFPEWHVDCEYNRRHDQVKRLHFEGGDIRADDTEARTVFPDIIVHRRRTDQNLIVLEVKKAGGIVETHDIEKLLAFTGEPEYRYRLGLFLRIGPILDSQLRVFREGREEAPWTEDLQRALGGLGYGG